AGSIFFLICAPFGLIVISIVAFDVFGVGIGSETKIILNNEGISVKVFGEEFYRWKDINYFVMEDRQVPEGGSATIFILHFHDGKTAEIQHYFTEKTSAELLNLFQAYLRCYHE
ncbi:MAG: hypothetical protein ICV65_19980, partial [Flavisolibacter sp.]|nr:hypothetical protein [Flavisolibacter sp.]